jgi:hypothetical protein
VDDLNRKMSFNAAMITFHFVGRFNEIELLSLTTEDHAFVVLTLQKLMKIQEEDSSDSEDEEATSSISRLQRRYDNIPLRGSLQ